jgi:hypothetical protein
MEGGTNGMGRGRGNEKFFSIENIIRMGELRGRSLQNL